MELYDKTGQENLFDAVIVVLGATEEEEWEEYQEIPESRRQFQEPLCLLLCFRNTESGARFAAA